MLSGKRRCNQYSVLGITSTHSPEKASSMRKIAALLLLSQFSSALADLSLELTIERVDDGNWVADYVFNQPVSELTFGPAPEGYREQAWQVLTPGEASVSDKGDLTLTQAVERIQIRIAFFAAYPPSFYVPAARFSHGGAALYTGYLLPDLRVDQQSVTPQTQVYLTGREGEKTLLTAAGRGGEPGFAYFGPSDTQSDWGFADVVLDPALPAWIEQVFRSVLEQVSDTFSERLPDALPSRPLILAAAGDLDSIEGYSIKGGALADQILFTLRGPSLREQTDTFRHSMEKLMAHELAHLWQTGLATRSRNTEDPWIHEGGADAMAVAALASSDVWSQEQVAEFAKSRAEACDDATNETTLKAALESGNYDAAYSCGFTQFWSSEVDIFDLWAAIERLAISENRDYTQALYDLALRSLRR